MPEQGFTVVTAAPRAGERWTENWGQWWGKRAGLESCVCSVTIQWLLRFPAFSIPSQCVGRWAGESKAVAVLHTPASTPGRCHTALSAAPAWDALTGEVTRGWVTHLVTNAVWYPPARNALQYQQPWDKCIKGKTTLNIPCGYQTSPTRTCILLLLPWLYFQVGFQEHLSAWSTSPVKSPKPRLHPYT